MTAVAMTSRYDWDAEFAAMAAARIDQDLALRYTVAFPEGYKRDFEPGRALSDVAVLERLGVGTIDVRLYRPSGREPGEWRLTLYVGGRSASLSDVLPVLQSLGVEILDERPYVADNSNGTACRIYEFRIRYPESLLAEDVPGEPDFEQRCTETVAAIWAGRAEADGFNELVARAGLTWRQVGVLRAFGNYLGQAGFPYSRTHIATVLGEHPDVVREVVRLFELRFDPAVSDHSGTALVDTVNAGIGAVLNLDDDRILRAYLGLVEATLRTSYFVRSGSRDRMVADHEFVAFKFDPRAIPELPRPRPRFEIYVYSPWVEGVHMRFGPVARGGLRWSERREDFRTEILGLVKAQAVKNAVIVPVGAKGGFVVKRPPRPTGDPVADRDAQRAEGIRCYRTFISGLLELTDNVDVATSCVLPAPGVVRRDEDDSYLVVAADKGTATFSDIANDVAAQYDFWLGDAFASGGSAGYDHKALGITAKGAWESVRRHFREMGIDTRSEDFTAVGIGDMSGDVFGNGMLTSEHIRLVAAFDHRHIFLDPDPDAAVSFAERNRLFALPRSSWADYTPDLISAGGGVWKRSGKSVPISAQARAVLGLAAEVTELSPPELVRAILCAPVDLLWNGGIGTYVKAGTESHVDVGDKGNDGVRVDAADIRARCVGEGGNLGFTSLARIEYARGGGRINTDALDNSAGVDCSDHEVNIKVLLDGLVTSGRSTARERDSLLAALAPEVARMVLAHNTSQNELLGTSRATAIASAAVHARLTDHLESVHGLDRVLEALPSKKEMALRQRSEHGFTSPELATLLAHVKLGLKADLLACDLPDDPDFAGILRAYFPKPLRDDFGPAIADHRLRREIVATCLANDVVDRAGITYSYRLWEQAGAGSADAVRAFVIVSEVFDLPRLWRDIRDGGLGTDVSDELMIFTQRLLDRAARWMLTHRPQPLAVGAEIDRFRESIAELTEHVADWISGADAENLRIRTDELVERGAPERLTHRVQLLLDRFVLLDIVEISGLAACDPHEVARLYYCLGEHLGLVPLLLNISRLRRQDRWQALARLSLRDELYDTMRALCLDILSYSNPGDTPQLLIQQWQERNHSRFERVHNTLGAIGEFAEQDFAALSVATRQLRSLARATSGG